MSKNKKRPIMTFWNRHKKKIIIITSVTFAIILTALGVKYWNAKSFERWLSNAPLNELEETRDNLHSEYMRHRINDDHRENLQNAISRIDKKMRELKSTPKTPSGPAYHREHGTNLYKRD